MHQFYGILDTGYLRPEEFSSACKALIAGGASLLQFRAKDLDHAQRIEILDTIVPICTVPLIINDHIDLALRYEKTGLHVGQDDMSPKEARAALGEGRILGLSTHSIEQAKGAIEQADLLDYFAVGPVFPTQTKPDYQSVGLELVEAVSTLKPPLPFYSIGGISRKNVQQVLGAGAQNVCVVSDILCAEDREAATKELLAVMNER